ncbi:AbgT family transporter [Corynebacterium pseudopelargi]|uniref:p-aminobenzoyl-glutamate transport protein n=1 Tax=Corynebacterium pseudopelargi TaxID=2080757 RepID=A0A3G6IVR7_9CORY|nr:AbgT family transporter [Corynebacterium pseudopelargi]AZA09772.1 p-aminobenzoyl-glutamate transport protein [Corynebacterium pseudopelargi]
MTQTKTKDPSPQRASGLLGVIERIGNKLPDPFWLFVILAGVVAISSWIGSTIGMSATDPQSGEKIEVSNLLTSEGITRMVTDAIKNFTDFPPLGVILTVMLGVAVAEHTGLISALVRAMVAKVGPTTLTFAVALAGVTGSIASDAVYVILIPLGAMSFRALGRSPIVGAMVAFAASSAGFNASLILNITDVLLGGISTSAAQLVDENYEVSPLANYFFVVASSIVLALIITAVTELFIKNKARELVDHDDLDYSELTFKESATAPAEQSEEELKEEIKLEPQEVRALWFTLLAAVLSTAAYFILMFWPASPLYSPEGALEGPLIRSVAIPIAGIFFILGIVYGVVAGTITKAADIPEFMAKGLKTLLPMIVLFFAVAQFLAWFQWSNLGIWTAIKGSELLQQWDLPVYVLFAALVLMVALLNIFITSGSAQWALMAPVIVPMMMYVHVSPEVSQMLFRIGDSPSNIITPMSPYFALALTFLQRYYKRAGVGTLMSLALPYSIAMLVGWFLFFVIWYALGIPIGPGTPTTYPA